MHLRWPFLMLLAPTLGVGCARQECRVVPLDDQPTVLDVGWRAEDGSEALVVYGEEDDRAEAWSEDGLFRSLLLGLPTFTDVDVRGVEVRGGRERTVCRGSAQTGGFGPSLPTVTSSELLPVLRSSEPWLLAVVMGDTEQGLAILDRQGRIVWWAVGGPGEALVDTHFAPGTNDILYNAADAARQDEGSVIRRIDIRGELIDEVETPRAHHVFAPLDDGTVGYIAAELGEAWHPDLEETVSAVGDSIVEIAPDGSQRKIFDTWDWLEVDLNEAESGFYPGAYDWTHGNSLHIDPDGTSWWLTLAHVRTVVQVDRETGEPIRILGGETGYPSTGGEPTFSVAHDMKRTEAGTLLGIMTWGSATSTDTVAIEYAIDDERGVIEPIWSYGLGEGVLANFLGQAVPLENGNRLVNYGGAGVMREVTLAGELVWEVRLEAGQWFGQVRPIRDIYQGQ